MSDNVTIGDATLYHGDNLDVLRTLAADSIDAIVTDPPYGLGFMGKGWDHGVPGIEYWICALRVAKPGAHLLAFGGTRTFHRLACAIEDAGWDIRDCVMWVYGSGFPKSLDVAKAIDKTAGVRGSLGDFRSAAHAIQRKPGNERVHEGYQRPWRDDLEAEQGTLRKYIPATDAACQWQGWGTALKPAWEPIIVARKPLIGTVAGNVLTHATGAINIDASRVGADGGCAGGCAGAGAGAGARVFGSGLNGTFAQPVPGLGRWPANVMHDGSDEVVALFPSEAGAAAPVHQRNGDKFRTAYGAFAGNVDEAGSTFQGDSGSAARFFYCAKASASDRDGLTEEFLNTHPTVKPTELMRYFCRLVTPVEPLPANWSRTTPPGGGVAAIADSFRFIGIEKRASVVRYLPRADHERPAAGKDVRMTAPNQECPVCGAGLPPDVASDEPTLRDLFAAAVLAGSPSKADPQAEVEHAYMIAELMLARRKKK